MTLKPSETSSDILENLKSFIQLSLQKDEKTWEEWISVTVKSLTTHCWEKKKCESESCPAYKNECGRCWLIAGTMCGGEVQGTFANKYESCCQCDVFNESISAGQTKALQEHILILIHSLRMKHQELKEALEEIKTLKGIIPICMTCKKIRDDNGYWNQLETYISEYSEAKFSHGICPECLEERRPEIYEREQLK